LQAVNDRSELRAIPNSLRRRIVKLHRTAIATNPGVPSIAAIHNYAGIGQLSCARANLPQRAVARIFSQCL